MATLPFPCPLGDGLGRMRGCRWPDWQGPCPGTIHFQLTKKYMSPLPIRKRHGEFSALPHGCNGTANLAFCTHAHTHAHTHTSAHAHLRHTHIYIYILFLRKGSIDIRLSPFNSRKPPPNLPNPHLLPVPPRKKKKNLKTFP